MGLIRGELYPVSVPTQVLSQLLQYIFFVGFFLVLLGEWLFTSAVQWPAGLRLVQQMKANQVVTMVLLFACNIAASSLLSTGAFEVHYNEQLVHSKLATGHAPDIGDMLARFRDFEAGASAGQVGY